MFKRKEPVVATELPRPKRRFTDAFETMDTVIGSQVRFQGEIAGSTNLEIRGQLEGNAEIDGLVVLRKEGRCRGQIKATSALLEGTLEGTVEVAEKIELGSTARVMADLSARSVAIAEGSYFQGKVQMETGEGAGKEDLSFEERRKAPD